MRLLASGMTLAREIGQSGRGDDHAYLHWHAELDGSGIRAVKDTPKRIQAARESAKKFGVEIKQIFLTSGEFDILVIYEAPSAEHIAKLAMTNGALGSVRTRTVQAWPEAEMVKLISDL